MIKIYHRHPNLIKVINVYYSIISILIIIILQNIFSIIISILCFFILQEYSIKLISKKILINTESEVKFSTFFIGNAYGLGILKLENRKIIGIHIKDYESLKDKYGKIRNSQ